MKEPVSAESIDSLSSPSILEVSDAPPLPDTDVSVVALSGPLKPVSQQRRHVQYREQVVQAANLYSERLLEGKSVAELAKEHDLLERTVKRRISLAKFIGVPEKVREIFITDMLPVAMAVVQETLASPDPKLAFSAARLVIEKLKVLEPPERESDAPKEDESLESWRTRVIDVTPTEVKPTADPPPASEGSGDDSEELPLRESLGEAPPTEDSPSNPSEGSDEDSLAKRFE